jgi:hypothetical protein
MLYYKKIIFHLRNRSHPAINIQDTLTNMCNLVPITDALKYIFFF